MCGIVFVSDLNERTAEMLPWLSYGIRYRGGDSWGMTNGREARRELGPITASFDIPPESWWGRPLLIHTRAATVGDVTVPNCHPFDVTGKRGRIQGIHNGSVSNWKELNEKYKRELEVDSHQIFAHLADELPTGELRMRGVIAWLEDDSPNIHFARSASTDLSIMKLTTGEIIGCSVPEPILFGAEEAGLEIYTTYKMAENERHYLIRRTEDRDYEGVDLTKSYFQPGSVNWTAIEGEPMPFNTYLASEVSRALGFSPTQAPFEHIHSGMGTGTGPGKRFFNGHGHGTSRSSGAGQHTTEKGTNSNTGAKSGGGSVASEPFRFKICACCNEALPTTPIQPYAFCVRCICAWLDAAVEQVRAEARGPALAPNYPGKPQADVDDSGADAGWSVLKEAERQISALAHEGEDRSEHYCCASREGCDPTLW